MVDVVRMNVMLIALLTTASAINGFMLYTYL